MSEPTDEHTAEIDRALREAQLQERAEQRDDLERQLKFDSGIADALSGREDDAK